MIGKIFSVSTEIWPLVMVAIGEKLYVLELGAERRAVPNKSITKAAPLVFLCQVVSQLSPKRVLLA